MDGDRCGSEALRSWTPANSDSLIKILDELVAGGGLVREVDLVTGMTVYREPSIAGPYPLAARPKFSGRVPGPLVNG
jgi:hypothetical protein